MGTLTTGLGVLEAGRIGFIQDASGGIAIRLDAAMPSPLPAGTSVIATGSTGSYFSLRTLNAASDSIVVVGTSDLPAPVTVATGLATEPVEGLRLAVTGTVTAAPSALTDGLGVTIDDGSGQLRLIVADAALAGVTVGTGDIVTAIGPLGQRDSSGTGMAGYRIHATLPGEFTNLPEPTPEPTATPQPSESPLPSATPTPTPTPTPTASPTPSPTPTPTGLLSIGEARQLAIGTTVRVAGVVTAEGGRLGTPPLIAIQDATGGIVVHLPDGMASPARGALLEVTGPLSDPHGQLEIRPTAGGLSVVGTASLPNPVAADASTLDESVEGRLVTVRGAVETRPTKASSGDITFYVLTSRGSVRVVADASTGLTPDSVSVGATYDVTGVAGQRASRKGLLDGYRVWIRDAGDLVRTSAPSPSPSPSSAPSGSPTPPPGSTGIISIADAVRRGDGRVTVEGLVTTAADLLDSTGRRIVIEDRTAGVEILIPADGAPPAVGNRIRVDGTIGRAYDAPRIKADAITVVAVGGRPLALDLQRAPTAAHEWRLVRVTGTVLEVHKLGDRWRAEVSVGPDRVAISGLSGARIPSTALAEGRTAAIVGVVRRPYPGAADRRWAIAPRAPTDIVLGTAGSAGTATGGGATQRPGDSGAAQSATDPATPNVDLADLSAHVGSVVRVGGLVTELLADGFLLDDGTAIGRIALVGAAAEYLPLLEPGDALNATGRVERDGEEYRVLVEDAAGIVRVGDPTLEPIAAAPAGGTRREQSDSRSPEPAEQLAGGLLGPDDPGTAGIVGIVLVSAASLAVTVLRRQQARRRLAARVAARLATLTATHGPER
jgi:hypothetical protein